MSKRFHPPTSVAAFLTDLHRSLWALRLRSPHRCIHSVASSPPSTASVTRSNSVLVIAFSQASALPTTFNIASASRAAHRAKEQDFALEKLKELSKPATRRQAEARFLWCCQIHTPRLVEVGAALIARNAKFFVGPFAAGRTNAGAYF
jgi:hypothetical protein